MNYAIGDKVLFRPMGNGENSTPYEGVVTERACMGYVKVRITDGKWHEFHDWVNADTHVICKLTPAPSRDASPDASVTKPKPKKLVTRPREAALDSVVKYRIRGGVAEFSAGTGRWARSRWNTEPVLHAEQIEAAHDEIRLILSLLKSPTETVEVDDE